MDAAETQQLNADNSQGAFSSQQPKEAETVDFVPTQSLKVSHWSPSVQLQQDEPDAMAWVVQSSIDADKPSRIWTQPKYIKTFRELYPDDSGISTAATRNGGFVKGRALIHPCITIETEGTDRHRPPFVWRTVHSGQPYGGRQSRSREGINPTIFQISLEKHANWNNRKPSPFMSTADLSKCIGVAAHYEARGFEDIELLKIRTTGPEWDHEKQRLWNARYLFRRFRLERLLKKPYYKNEYLVEDSLPTKCITRYKWNDVKRMLDKDGSVRRKARLNYKKLLWQRKYNRKRTKRTAAASAKAQDISDGMNGTVEVEVGERKLRDVRKRSRGFARMGGTASAEA